MTDVMEHIEKIADLLGASALPAPMRDMVLGWLKNRPSEEIQEKLRSIKQYLSEQNDI